MNLFSASSKTHPVRPHKSTGRERACHNTFSWLFSTENCLTRVLNITLLLTTIDKKNLKFHLAMAEADSEDPFSTAQENVEEWLAAVMCSVCGLGSDEDNILLCDVCNDAQHLYCCTPALKVLPPEEDMWFCQTCAEKVREEREGEGEEEEEEEEEEEKAGSTSSEPRRKKRRALSIAASLALTATSSRSSSSGQRSSGRRSSARVSAQAAEADAPSSSSSSDGDDGDDEDAGSGSGSGSGSDDSITPATAAGAGSRTRGPGKKPAVDKATGRRPQPPCPTCGRTFTSMYGRNYHMRMKVCIYTYTYAYVYICIYTSLSDTHMH